jgi:hypothetical protein
MQIVRSSQKLNYNSNERDLDKFERLQDAFHSRFSMINSLLTVHVENEMPIAEEICDSMQVTLLKNYNLRKLITDI